MQTCIGIKKSGVPSTRLHKKVCIAIMDTGICIKTLERYVSAGTTFLPNYPCSNFEDDHRHGTCCAYTILRITRDVTFYIVKILNSTKRASSAKLLEALEHLLDIDVDIILMSLATPNFNSEMQNVCKQLHEQGKILVAAQRNDCLRSYPAEFPMVLGVSGRLFESAEHYWFNEDYLFQAISDKTPIWVPGIENNHYYVPFYANSKATAVFAGILAKFLSNGTPPKALTNCIIKHAAKNIWDPDCVDNENPSFHSQKWETKEKPISMKALECVMELICCEMGLTKAEVNAIKNENLFKLGFTVRQYGKLLHDLESIVGSDFSFHDINAQSVGTVCGLASLI